MKATIWILSFYCVLNWAHVALAAIDTPLIYIEQYWVGTENQISTNGTLFQLKPTGGQDWDMYADYDVTRFDLTKPTEHPEEPSYNGHEGAPINIPQLRWYDGYYVGQKIGAGNYFNSKKRRLVTSPNGERIFVLYASFPEGEHRSLMATLPATETNQDKWKKFNTGDFRDFMNPAGSILLTSDVKDVFLYSVESSDFVEKGRTTFSEEVVNGVSMNGGTHVVVLTRKNLSILDKSLKPIWSTLLPFDHEKCMYGVAASKKSTRILLSYDCSGSTGLIEYDGVKGKKIAERQIESFDINIGVQFGGDDERIYVNDEYGYARYVLDASGLTIVASYPNIFPIGSDDKVVYTMDVTSGSIARTGLRSANPVWITAISGEEKKFDIPPFWKDPGRRLQLFLGKYLVVSDFYSGMPNGTLRVFPISIK